MDLEGPVLPRFLKFLSIRKCRSILLAPGLHVVRWVPEVLAVQSVPAAQSVPVDLGLPEALEFLKFLLILKFR